MLGVVHQLPTEPSHWSCFRSSFFWHTTSSLIESWIFFNYYSKTLLVWFQLIYKSEKKSFIIQSLILVIFSTCPSWFLATWVYIGKSELQRRVKIPNPSVKPETASSDAVRSLPAFVAIFGYSWSRKLTYTNDQRCLKKVNDKRWAF